MLVELNAIEKEARLAAARLHHEHMPTVERAKDLQRLVVSLPRVDANRLPRHAVEPGARIAPAAVGQVFPIELAVLGVEVEAQRTHRIEGLHDDIAIGSLGRRVAEADSRRVGAFEIFARVAQLRVQRALRRAVGARSEAQQAVATPLRVIDEADAVGAPRCARDAGVARPVANDPAVARELSDVALAEVVEEDAGIARRRWRVDLRAGRDQCAAGERQPTRRASPHQASAGWPLGAGTGCAPDCKCTKRDSTSTGIAHSKPQMKKFW